MGVSNVFLTLDEKGFRDGRTDASGNSDILHASGDQLWGSSVGYGRGSIEVLEYSFTIAQKGSEEGGRPRSVESVSRTPLTIVKWADSRTPMLFYYCASGKYIKDLRLKVYGDSNASPYLEYEMGYVHISSFQPSGGEDLSKETVQFTYGQMKVTCTTGRGTVQRMWSWVMDMPKEAPKLPGIPV